MKIQKSKIFADITGEQAVVRFLLASVRDMSEVQKIMDEIEEVAYNYKVTVLVLNFGRLRQVTSGFLGRLIPLNKGLQQAGIALRLCSMAPEVEEAFRICKLQKIIPLYDSEDKALSG
jgi:anti-anti-sigma factor